MRRGPKSRLAKAGWRRRGLRTADSTRGGGPALPPLVLWSRLRQRKNGLSRDRRNCDCPAEAPKSGGTSMDKTQERSREIDAAVADIRAIEQRGGVTRSNLAKIRHRLIQLAARTDLFTLRDFPPPEPGGKRKSCLYRL